MKKGKSFWLVEEVLDASSPFHARPSMYIAVLPNSLLAMSLDLWPPTTDRHAPYHSSLRSLRGEDRE